MDKATFLDIVEIAKSEDDRPKVLRDLIRRPNSFRYYKLFPYLTKVMNPELIIELGTAQGIGALHFRHGSTTAKIITVDIKRGQKCKDRLFAHDIKGVLCDSTEYADYVADQSVNILFCDANHTYDSVMKEMAVWIPKMALDSVILFDDVDYDIEKRETGYVSKHNKLVATGEATGMSKAWKEIKETIDGDAFEVPWLHATTNFGVLLR